VFEISIPPFIFKHPESKIRLSQIVSGFCVFYESIMSASPTKRPGLTKIKFF